MRAAMEGFSLCALFRPLLASSHARHKSRKRDSESDRATTSGVRYVSGRSRPKNKRKTGRKGQLPA